ncbi:MAG: thiamine phosphate synthase [Burkholderiaceae bacterium]|nr:thiamine phosphate synthase [Burkholderiaceae bacterium]
MRQLSRILERTIDPDIFGVRVENADRTSMLRSTPGLGGRHLPTGLYVLTPETGDDVWLVSAVSAAIRGGASTVQYRNKTLAPLRRLQQATKVRELCREAGATFVVNDSIELAAALDADGVHLGRDDAAIADARAALGAGTVIGVSCYDSLARAMEFSGLADYFAFGSVFPSETKPTAVRATLDLFARAREQGLHAVAIGGIDASNAAKVAAAGARAVAVITAVFGATSSLAKPNRVQANARRIRVAFASAYAT